eukprot:NODE_3590_length_907_cov_12.179487_g2988_i0.p1 GENE.NODE_3590_length_907_cov_12.179487_g2988_i0~~NODE_3590_length_907_cov_12.179487_g2988_i0.p1  ORF type:complete len:211 (-),score=25.96 NODE_3590_length_907_cov_12.179487_g2988_i0:202-834(-)
MFGMPFPPAQMASAGPMECRWSPYENNGGTCVAIGGKGFAVVGADTRMSKGFSIVHRNHSKLFQPTPPTVLASGGMAADRLALQKDLAHELQWYAFNNQGKVPEITSLQKLISVTLYGRRFAPYYSFNMLAGLNKENEGVCYHFDIFGNTEERKYAVCGTAEPMVCFPSFFSSSSHCCCMAFLLPMLDRAFSGQHDEFAAPAQTDARDRC